MALGFHKWLFEGELGGLDGAAGLTLPVGGAAGLEVGFGFSIAVVGGEGSGLPIPDAEGAVRVVELHGPGVGFCLLEEGPGSGGVVIGAGGFEVGAMALIVIHEALEISPGLAGGRRGRGDGG